MQKGIASLLCTAILAGASLTSAVPAGASPDASTQAATPSAPETDKPFPARVSAIDGSLSVARGDAQKPVEGTLNAPVFPGDYLSTGGDTDAEIQLDGFTMLRLGSNVQAHVAASDAKGHRLELADGTVEVALLHAEGAPTTIDTPSVTIRIATPGDVRVTVAGGVTTATARAGEATLESPQHGTTMESGKTYVASGNATNPNVTSEKEISYDAFDEYNARRDKTTLAAVGDANVPPAIAGYDDLNKYGRWVEIDPYGTVWIPNGVASDWAPYRDGQWTWSSAYGWTWVSNEAWGWVPYHYGRWFYQDGYGWCWLPPVVATAIWQPALVAFFGWGWSSAWSWGSGYGNVGWVPLGPYETYVPWYNGGYDRWVYVAPPPSPSPGPTRPPGPRSSVPVHRKPPSIPRGYRNAAYATSVGALAFHQGDFSEAKPVDLNRAGHAAVLAGPLPIAVTPQNAVYARTPVKSAPLRPAAAWDRYDMAREGHTAYPLSSRAQLESALAPIRTAPVRTTAAASPAPSHVGTGSSSATSTASHSQSSQKASAPHQQPVTRQPPG